MIRMRLRLICLIVLAIIMSCSVCSGVSVLADEQDKRVVKVGLLSSINERRGKMAPDFINMAISDFYEIHPNYKTRLLLQVRDSQNQVITSAANVEDLIKYEKVIAIIGPETSQEAVFDIILGERSKVPIISYSASSPMLSSPYFIQATHDDSSQVEAISSIIKAFDWREVILVYVNNEFGVGIIPFLDNALQKFNIMISYMCHIPSSATNDQIVLELSKLRDLQTRVFVVHMTETLASRVFLLAKEHGMTRSDYVWIITSNIANELSTLDNEVIQSMQGVIGVKTYVPNSQVVKRFNSRRQSQGMSFNLDSSKLIVNLHGLWAYDATFMLAEAVERVGESSFTSLEIDDNKSNTSIDLLTFRVSDVGPQLIQRLLNTNSFTGLSGNFSLVNGRLQTRTYEIINVIGTGERTVGFWTQANGLSRKLDVTSTNSPDYLTSKDNLNLVIWPGGEVSIPKGYVVLVRGPYLKIGVPWKVDFTEFVNVSKNSMSNEMKISGFCIDVFQAVIENISYPLPIKYIPSNDSYDDLIIRVYNKEIDGLVGDVTITPNRSLYVGFTESYLDGGILMVEPAIKESGTYKAWKFLRPLSWKLWLTTLCFFILIAFAVWVNEYQINNEFRAESWKDQIGLCLFFSFSTMVFSHKESPKSNLSRLVLVLWLFTLLLFTQSYTATLTSFLTVEKLHYDDISGATKVGCQGGSFVIDYIRMNLRVYDTKILTYGSVEELHQLLSLRGEKGGIDVAIDEAPYINLFLGRYCNETYKVTAMTITTKIDVDSFVALFAITGGVAIVAIVFKLGFFLYQNRRLWQTNKTLNQTLSELNCAFHAKKETPTTCSSYQNKDDTSTQRKKRRRASPLLHHTNSAPMRVTLPTSSSSC